MAFVSDFKQNLRENHGVAHTDRTVSMRGRRLGRIGMGRGSHTHAPRRPKELGLAWLGLGFGLVLGLGLGLGLGVRVRVRVKSPKVSTPSECTKSLPALALFSLVA